MPGNTDAGTHSLDYERKLQKQPQAETSESLPKNVSLQLLDLMKKVVANDVNPATVKAACQCAREIHNMLKLNLEIIKKS